MWSGVFGANGDVLVHALFLIRSILGVGRAALPGPSLKQGDAFRSTRIWVRSTGK
jgi:hypothetical protein